MKSVRMIAAGLAACGAIAVAAVVSPVAEAKKPHCTDVSGVGLGGIKKEAERGAKASASASANAYFGGGKIKVKPYKVVCEQKLVFVECTAATKACKW